MMIMLKIVPMPGFCFKKNHSPRVHTLTIKVTTPIDKSIFNDIPWHKFRESEAHAWAKAGFSWVVNDAEHSQWEGWYGREHNAAESRLGLLAVQRLHREARSAHGDVYQMGARASLRPYSTTYEDAEAFFKSVTASFTVNLVLKPKIFAFSFFNLKISSITGMLL